MKMHHFRFVAVWITLSVSLLGCIEPSFPEQLTEKGHEEGSASSNILTLSDEKHELSISVSEIPALQAYLEQYSPEEIEAEKGRMSIESFTPDQSTMFYVLKYNCGSKLCDIILLKKTGAQIQSRPLVELVTFRGYTFSPDRKKLALEFGRNDGMYLDRETLVVIDVQELKPFREEKQRINNTRLCSTVSLFCLSLVTHGRTTQR